MPDRGEPARRDYAAHGLHQRKDEGGKSDRHLLLRARFDEVDLSGGAGLEQGQLDQACGDGATILPAGLTVPTHCPAPKSRPLSADMVSPSCLQAPEYLGVAILSLR